MKIIKMTVESFVNTHEELIQIPRIEICSSVPCGPAATVLETLATIEWSKRSGEINSLLGRDLDPQEVEAAFPEILRMMEEARRDSEPQVDRRDPSTKRCVLQNSDLRVRVWERPLFGDVLLTKAEKREALLMGA